jgi:hypothetical protein
MRGALCRTLQSAFARLSYRTDLQTRDRCARSPIHERSPSWQVSSRSGSPHQLSSAS